MSRGRTHAVKVFERPWWVAKAACRGQLEIDLFFPTGRGYGWQALRVREVCCRCRVRAHCLAWALEHGELGIWAGTTEDCRINLRRATCEVCRAELDPIDVWNGAVEPCAACLERMLARNQAGRRARQSWRLIQQRAS